MTNKEILHADILDILFKNRNKAYGAYVLRRNYNHRLQWAMAVSLGERKIVLVRFMVNTDGAISKTEIVQAGGDKFDREVIRVFA